MQVLGTYGVMNEYPVERRMWDANVNQIFAGTSQIHRIVVGRVLEGIYEFTALLRWSLVLLQTMR